MDNVQTHKPYNPTPPKYKKPRILTGLTFGYLTAVAYWSVYKTSSQWLCRCKCGEWTVPSANQLLSGHTTSCGCYAREVCIARSTIHGEGTRKKKTAEYEVYKGLRKRCYNQNCQDYPDYGGRGIECRFTSFTEFLAEVGRRPTAKHKIDRIDNDGHYEAGNVRWATDIESANNKRNNRMLTLNGVTDTLPNWARTLGVKARTLHSRRTRGWTDVEILATKIRKG